jgi:hypothetical protein
MEHEYVCYVCVRACVCVDIAVYNVYRLVAEGNAARA